MKSYEDAKIEVEIFTTGDVITTSGDEYELPIS